MVAKGEKILVTGGAGYVGSHAVRAAENAGYAPVVLDDLSMGHRAAVQCPIEEARLGAPGALDALFEAHRFAAVMHFAGSCAVGESVRDPLAYYRNNVGETLALLDAVRQHGTKRFVFSSSCSVYGHPEAETLSERHACNPVSPYGRTKWMIEHVLRDVAEAHGICAVSLRYFNAAGADAAGDIGEHHHPETHLIPIVLSVALGQRAHVEVFGDDYETPDGTCIRDYVHVSDLADAHVRALTLQGPPGHQALNLGTGKGASVLEVVGSARRVTGIEIPVQRGARRPGDPACLVAAAERASHVLGWSPRFTTLDDIVASAWRWHEKNPNGYSG